MTFLVRRAKYNSKTTSYGERSYHSKKEAGYAQTLDLLKKASNPSERVVSWTPQYSVDVYVDGATLTLKKTPFKLFRIIPDFLVTFADGHQEIHEVKSSFTATLGNWRVKWRILEAVFAIERPDIGLVVIK